MHWSIALFTVFSGCAAGFSGYVAYRCRRDANNWHIDVETKLLTFHGWTEYLFALTMCFLGLAIVILAVVL